MTQQHEGSSPVRAFPELSPFAAGAHAHDPQDVERLALSESPYGASPLAQAAAEAETARMHWYPHSDNEPLRSAIAAHYGVTRDAVVVGNGLDEVILKACLATRVPGRHGVFTENTFFGYDAALRIVGQHPVGVPLRDRAIDVDAVLAAMDGAGIVIVCNPHNPTGSSLPADAVSALVERARAVGAVLVLDEAYAEFADADERVFGSGIRHLDGGSVVVLRTLSKAYGLAGVRVGYALGDARLIAAMQTAHHALPYTVNRFALAAGTAALGDQDHVRAVIEGNRRTRAALVAELAARGIATLPSQTNFVLAHLAAGGRDVIGRLAHDHAIHVRDASALGFPEWARVTVPHPDRLSQLTAALDLARDQAGDDTTEGDDK